MQPFLLEIRETAIKEIKSATSAEELEQLRVKYLGRNSGVFKKIFEDFINLPVEQKKVYGPLTNQVKSEIEDLLAEKQKEFVQVPQQKQKRVDITLPSNEHIVGHIHPVIQTIERVKEIFGHLGFSYWDGPEIESDLYNFQLLRLHENHPSRDTQDTYYIDEKTTKYKGKEKLLLRTHTSSMQVRYMREHKPPIRALFPGRAFRRDAIDATHLPAFFQIEGLLVGERVRVTDLLGTLKYFIANMFGPDIKVRFYGHNFPYTEPSIEVEIFYRGKWLEILGSGMVHPEVIANAGYDPEKYTGFAFGMGAERLALIKYEIDDIRHFYHGDLRFLEQF